MEEEGCRVNIYTYALLDDVVGVYDMAVKVCGCEAQV